MNFKVCIIVPVYNVSKYMERCARSLFEQTFDNIQYVFVNDCTPDNSVEILQNVLGDYPYRKPNVKIVSHDKNRGIAAARNTGLTHAEAEYTLYIDSDDFIELNMVELMYSKAQEEKADIVICDFLMDWGKVTKIAYQPCSVDNIEFTKLLLSANTMPGMVNKLIHSNLYKKYNIYFVEGINMGEDYSTTPCLAYYARKIAKVDLPLYHYVQTNNNSYTKSFSEKSSENLISAIEVLDSFFSKVTDSDIFKESILEGKLRKKISMLMQSPPEIREKIAGLFPETDKIRFAVNLRQEERIALFLANKKLFKTLNIFLFVYWQILEFIQILKGRRQK